MKTFIQLFHWNWNCVKCSCLTSIWLYRFVFKAPSSKSMHPLLRLSRWKKTLVIVKVPTNYSTVQYYSTNHCKESEGFVGLLVSSRRLLWRQPAVALRSFPYWLISHWGLSIQSREPPGRRESPEPGHNDHNTRCAIQDKTRAGICIDYQPARCKTKPRAMRGEGGRGGSRCRVAAARSRFE